LLIRVGDEMAVTTAATTGGCRGKNRLTFKPGHGADDEPMMVPNAHFHLQYDAALHGVKLGCDVTVS
jgi:hypothetical protein